VNAGSSGIEVGWNANDANVDIHDVTDPFSGNYFTPTRKSGEQSRLQLHS